MDRACLAIWGICLVAAATSAALPPSPAPAAQSTTDQRAVRSLAARGPLANERLSDERRLSRYAGAVARAAVRSAAEGRAAVVGHLRYLTEDDTPEIYPVLESHVDERGQTWLRVRLPMRPNGRIGWVPRSALGPLTSVSTMLRVNRATLRATLYRNGRRIWSARIGVGASATPTPAGQFWIRSRLRALDQDPTYGPYAFGTGAYSVLSDWPGGGVVGIHGTDRPGLIPGRPSHGCIRLSNAAVSRLWRLMPLGTPVVIV